MLGRSSSSKKNEINGQDDDGLRIDYYGFTVLDFNYSSAAFRWVVGELLEFVPFGCESIRFSIRADIDNRGKSKVIGIRDTKNDGDGQESTAAIILEHDASNIWKFFLSPDDSRCVAYLVRTDPDFPYTCHVFRAADGRDAQEFVKLLRQAKFHESDSIDCPLERSNSSNVPSTTTAYDPFLKLVPIRQVPSSPCLSSSTTTKSSADIITEKIDSFASQFEVLYLCRVEMSSGAASSTIVDEAARRYDDEYRTDRARQYVAASVKKLMDGGPTIRDDHGLRTQLRFSETAAATDNNEDHVWEDEAMELHHQQQSTGSVNRRRRTSSLVIEALVDSVFLDDAAVGHASQLSPPYYHKKPYYVHGSSTTTSTPPSIVDVMKLRASANRAMLMSIGRRDVSLISLDHKQKLFSRRLTEISCVIQGSAKYANHFAFVCPDSWQNGRSDCFVIRCQDEPIASSAIRAMRTAFAAAFNDHVSAGGRQHVCDQCPLYQYSSLCSDVDGLNSRKVHDTLVNRINKLSPCHQELIWSGYKKLLNECNENTNSDAAAGDDQSSGTMKGTASENAQRKNVMLMSVLRSVCESAQVFHSRSVGKLFNGGGGAGTSTAATPTASEQDSRVYLTAVEGINNAAGTTSGKQRLATGDGGPSSTSTASRLVSLRDRARNAFGGSLDSFIKKKLSGNESGGGASTLTETNRVPNGVEEEDGGYGGGDGKPIIILFREESDQDKRAEDDDEMTQTLSSSPLTPLSPSGVATMTGSQATFHFETPGGRRVSEGDILRFRPRSSTVGEVPSAISSTTGAAHSHTPSKRERHIPATHSNYPNDRSNSSMVNMAALRGRRMSWRQAIFSRVVSPRLFVSRHSVAGLGPVIDDASPASRRSSGVSAISTASSATGGADETGQPAFYRSLWKKAIMEQILTLRLEHQKKFEDEDVDELRRLKLTYEEITPCSEDEVRPIWLAMLNNPRRHTTRFDRVQVEEAVKAGVPRDLRSEVWKFLLSQHALDRGKRSQMETPPPHQYRDLLKDLTSYQHAILIDLGRTFPTHNYFSQALGPGQLSLFNILKAYSLFDTEVGYCQGLSFIAGVLLLHMEEADAFEMLVDMMYRLQLRRQYRPDMMALQIEMYQLSRLLHDRHRDLHDHLEDHEIPVLYAAPWFLTLFASAFPLGFVARVFDFVFLSGGLDVVFKIALVLLGDHKELIKNCDSFESINDFLKTTLPSMSLIQMERIFNQVFELDVNRELLAFEVEYHVLQEEVLASSVPPPSVGPPSFGGGKPGLAPTVGNEMSKLDTANKFLKRQNMELLEQLQQAHYKLAVAEKAKLDAEAKFEMANDVANSYQCKINGLETRMEALELERKTLLATVQRLRPNPSSNESAIGKSNGMACQMVIDQKQQPSSISPSKTAAGTRPPPSSPGKVITNANGHRTS